MQQPLVHRPQVHNDQWTPALLQCLRPSSRPCFLFTWLQDAVIYWPHCDSKLILTLKKQTTDISDIRNYHLVSIYSFLTKSDPTKSGFHRNRSTFTEERHKFNIYRRKTQGSHLSKQRQVCWFVEVITMAYWKCLAPNMKYHFKRNVWFKYSIHGRFLHLRSCYMGMTVQLFWFYLAPLGGVSHSEQWREPKIQACIKP